MTKDWIDYLRAQCSEPQADDTSQDWRDEFEGYSEYAEYCEEWC